MLSACLLLLAGLGIIAHMPIHPGLRIILAAVWIADTVRELARQSRGHTRVRCLQLDSGGVMSAHDYSGKDMELQILKGSVVLQRWAWLQLEFDDGLHYVEWLFEKDYGSQTWRRFQLLWRNAL